MLIDQILGVQKIITSSQYQHIMFLYVKCPQNAVALTPLLFNTLQSDSEP